ncbi:MAG: hypothetical protein GXY57_01645, partial [Erysipelotrichaceae bacterium]|nr:hypothetical protein [Erysipelotrichaceae bacterium]
NVITISTTARIWTHEIKITALSAQSCALEFGQYFLDTTAAQCASKNVTSATWNTIQSFYNGLNVDIQNAIKASASNQNGNAMEHAMARYDDIISKYGLTDFLGTGNPSKGLNGMSNSSNYMLVFISVIGMFTAIGCTLYLVKKKKEKLS